MQRTETHIAMAEMPAKDYPGLLLERMCGTTPDSGPAVGASKRP
jgi:hypothetical protein